MMCRVCRREHHRAARSKCETHQSGAGNLDRRLTIWGDLDDPALTRKRRRHVQIAFDVKSQTLRPSQPAEEIGNVALSINPVHAVEARRCGTGNEQIASWTKRQVISGN